ncbi:uncharacterized protein [Epargyreus clarus]|uniref:uncharacterized protein n=1 Tax=Epargyreus clarus TaxID=520877 RepID=UPI003C2F06B9
MARATRIALDLALAAGKALRPGCTIAWRYAKVEMIPPMTKGFFHGPGGKKLEDCVSKMANNFIAGLEGRIRELEAEKERQIKAKEAAIKAAHDKAMAEAKKKEDARIKAEAEKKAREAKLAKEKADKAAKKEKVEKKADAKADAKAGAKADAKTDKPKEAKKSKRVKKKEIKKPKGKGRGKK